jgi:signal transduction histidine kinase
MPFLPKPWRTSTAPLKALLVASVLVPALVFAIAAWKSYNDAFRHAGERARHVSYMLEEHALKTLDSLTLVLRMTDQYLRGVDWETIRTSPALWQRVKDLQELTEQVGSIFVVDSAGNNPLTTRVFPPTDLNFSDRDYFYEHKDADRGVYIGRNYIGKISQGPIFNMSIRRSTPDGRFDGVIGISGFVEYFMSFYATAGIQDDRYAVVLLRDDGAAIVRYPRVDGTVQFPPHSPPVRELHENDATVFTAISPADGVERIYSAKKLKGFPLAVLYGIDRSTIIAAWRQDLLQWAALFTAVGTALFLISWLALRRTRNEAQAVARWRAASADLLQETEKRAELEAMVLQAQKQEAIGQITGGISHDFNNLLAVILGNLELLQRRVSGDERANRLLDGAMKGARRGAALTQRLLAFARRQDLSPRVLEVRPLIDGMDDLIRGSLGPEVETNVDIATPLPAVRVDKNQLEMALLNIVINARDATLPGGRITIGAREATIAGPQADGLAPGQYVCLSVTDTGIGMDEATLARATEPFFTTKGLGRGTGLGLSMVHGFALQSGGIFRLRSRVNVGTVAEIWLPSAGYRADSRPAPAASKPLKPIGAHRILLVDDDTLVGEAVVAMLEDLGHSATHVLSGFRAIEALEQDPTINLVITDHVMPGMSGLQLARRLRERWPDLPILLASGHGELTGKAELNLPLLSKPFRERDLARALEALVTAERGYAA